MSISFSANQRKIILSTSKKRIFLVIAYAGSGKSFTLKHFCLRRPSEQFIYFVYNASMKKDAEKSFKEIKNVDITTFHGLAFRHYADRFSERLSDDSKHLRPEHLVKIINRHMTFSEDEHGETERKYSAQFLFKAFEAFLASSLTVEYFVRTQEGLRKLLTESPAFEILDHHKLYMLIPEIWEKSIKNKTFPVLFDVPLKLYQLEGIVPYHFDKKKKKKVPYSIVLVDEAQDLNPVMIDIIYNQPSRIVAVGDPYQSIYSFRGAVNSLQTFHDLENGDVETFYLNESYRCSPGVAFLGDAVLTGLLGAKQPFIGVGSEKIGRKPSSAVIARTNAGLFDYCWENIGKPIHFAGGFSNYNFSDLTDLVSLMGGKHEYIKSKRIAKFSTFKEINEHARQTNDVSLLSSIGIVLKVIGKNENIFELVKEFKKMSTRLDLSEVVVTTAHKSKGLEWDYVELLPDFPFGKKKMEEGGLDVAEEYRLLYVAITRAKRGVVLPENIKEIL